MNASQTFALPIFDLIFTAQMLAVIFLVLITGILLRYNFLGIFTKPANNKLLLKELLEGFDLDIPDELKEIKDTYSKPIKTP